MQKIKIFFRNRLLIAFLAGSSCALAFAPFYFFIAAVISLSIFYFLLENCDKKSAAKVGFFYGFGYFLAGTCWISISLLVDAEKFAWLIPFALILIPSTLAIYFLLFAVSYKFFVKKFYLTKIHQRILAFTFFWLIFEILRSYLFSGFPWNLLGYIWMFDVIFAQSANIFAVYGLSGLAVLTCLFPILFLKLTPHFLTKKPFSEISFSDKIFAVILFLLFSANLIYGYCRIDDKKIIYDEKTKIRLVQGNVKQEMKWDVSEKYRNFIKHIELTNSQDIDGVKVVIWSETSVPYVIDEDSDELLRKLHLAVPNDGLLITGALRINYTDDSKSKISDVWNSIFTINKSGVVDHYDKHHLVPFGEYVPLQKFFPFIEKITDGAIGFSKGEGVKTVLTPYFSFSPLVCYEAIFPDEVVNRRSRPDLLVNLTNDAWFGNSSGPYQHFDMVRMRAIEQGISLARVANTGISGFIDPFGRVVFRINLNHIGIFDINLIKKLAPTVYYNYGFLPLILLLSLIFLFLTLKPHNKYDFRQNNTS